MRILQRPLAVQNQKVVVVFPCFIAALSSGSARTIAGRCAPNRRIIYIFLTVCGRKRTMCIRWGSWNSTVCAVSSSFRWRSCTPTASAVTRSGYQRITDYIRDNLGGDLSLDALSQSLFLSKYYIAHLFQEKTGLSIHQYITNKKTACRLRGSHAERAARQRGLCPPWLFELFELLSRFFEGVWLPAQRLSAGASGAHGGGNADARIAPRFRRSIRAFVAPKRAACRKMRKNRRFCGICPVCT